MPQGEFIKEWAAYCKEHGKITKREFSPIWQERKKKAQEPITVEPAPVQVPDDVLGSKENLVS